MDKKCLVCNKNIERQSYDNDQAWHKRKYCSFVCMGKDRAKTEELECSYCKNIVVVKQRRKSITNRIYCSRKCYSLYRKEVMPKEEQNSYNKANSLPDEERKRRNKVRIELNHAVRSGKVLKQPCNRCENDKAEAHHHDYNKPLDVEWLCRQCHRKEHTRLRRHDNPDLLTQ